MATQQQINGGTQIKAGTITTTQLAAAAAIADGQLAGTYAYADGTRAFTGNINLGSNRATNVAAPSISTDAANKAYVDAAVAALSGKLAAVAGTNTETLTIAGGSVTQIAGTTVNGVSPNVNDYVVIPNAPAATGAAGGASLTSQPANGLYQVTANTTNLTVARAPDMSGSINPMGATIAIAGGSVWGGAELMVTTPSTSAAFTYGTGSIAFVQISGAGEITTANVLSKTGNQLSVSAMATGTVILGNGGTPTIGTLSGDVALGATGVVTISAGAITLAKMANLAANSVIGNSTGSAGTPTAVPLSQSSSASSIPIRDGNGNLYGNAFIESVNVVASTGGTSTMTAASAPTQQITGSTTETVVTPNATGLPVGMQYWILNSSTGVVTVNANGGGLLQNMAAGSQLLLTLTVNGTAAGTWAVAYFAPVAGGTVTAVSVATANGLQGSSSGGATPVLTLQTSLGAGLVKSNGSNSFALASAGTDYLSPADLAFNEVPSGTMNGTNLSFTLANTPIGGGILLTQDGLVLRPGASFDYQLSGNTITFNTGLAPASTDNLLATYLH